MRKGSGKAREVQEWFATEVTFEGEPYIVDIEQAEAIADDSLNTIIVARAGSGKTRTLVAKIVYLIAKCGIRLDEIMAFVFNANAAAEINERLCKMMVGGVPIIHGAKIASTFHAFSRRIVYRGPEDMGKYGKILAGEKDAYIEEIVRGLVRKDGEAGRGLVQGSGAVELNEEELENLVRQMVSFVNRAEQQFLGAETNLAEFAKKWVERADLGENGRDFIRFGVNVYEKYLAQLRARSGEMAEFGMDFNLLVAEAKRVILAGGNEIDRLLVGKKYILVDEYQDFSQLFLGIIEAIRRVATEAKLFVVGDDWQAINRFAGSDVKFFKEFEKYFPKNSRRLGITTNYRCNYEIVGTARRFMKKAMKERGNFKAFSKKAGEVLVLEPNSIRVGYALTPYDGRLGAKDRKCLQIVVGGMGRMPKYSTVRYLRLISEIVLENRGAKDILVLHRNNETSIEGLTLEKMREIVTRLVMADVATSRMGKSVT